MNIYVFIHVQLNFQVLVSGRGQMRSDTYTTVKPRKSDEKEATKAASDSHNISAALNLLWSLEKTCREMPRNDKHYKTSRVRSSMSRLYQKSSKIFH